MNAWMRAGRIRRLDKDTERGTAAKRKPLSPALSPLDPRGERENDGAEISSQPASKLDYCSAAPG